MNISFGPATFREEYVLKYPGLRPDQIPDPFAAVLPPEEGLGQIEEADLPDPRNTQLAAQRLAPTSCATT